MSFHSPISNNNPEPNNRELLTFLAMVIGSIVLVFWLLSLLINNIINWIPVGVEQKLGSLIVPTYEQQAEKSAIQDKLNKLLDGLEKQLPQGEKYSRDYQVLYLPESTVNALAIPGDTIIIYQGLLDDVESENELTMILGHELGHFANRDHLRGLGNFLLVRIIISSFFGDLGSLQSAVDFGNAIANSQFSQKQESQADEFGLNLLYKYYNHVGGSTDFFQRLSKEINLNIAFLSTHPSPQKRVKKINQLIEQNKYPIEATKNLEFTN